MQIPSEPWPRYQTGEYKHTIPKLSLFRMQNDMLKTAHALCAISLIVTAFGYAKAETFTCFPGRICYDYPPCSAADGSQKDVCQDRAACNAADDRGLSFTINLPDQGEIAELKYPDLRSFQALVLSRSTSPYREDPLEQITLSVVPVNDDHAPNRTMIYLEVNRTADVTTAEAVAADLSTGFERGTVTIYSSCSAQ
ncbi:hypothetical protein HOY34_08355 [Xinfangfangia sp. D13-10-4-6]|uniref:hypothetical protein n=1 Tax=Pseudogemmobacter hezensis TaxID=2737662 RepID=UPI001557D5D5|nr:hypothetical protein [Pseudogemmobacter hezensis]NPD15208.1 hypothetical protein [Pseudogemmobacter hezensis]